jgi:hypothetical protein
MVGDLFDSPWKILIAAGEIRGPEGIIVSLAERTG